MQTDIIILQPHFQPQVLNQYWSKVWWSVDSLTFIYTIWFMAYMILASYFFNIFQKNKQKNKGEPTC